MKIKGDAIVLTGGKFNSKSAKTAHGLLVDLKSKVFGLPQGLRSLITKNVPTIPNADNKTVISNVTGIKTGRGRKSLPPIIIGQSIVVIPIIIVSARQVPKKPKQNAAIESLDLLYPSLDSIP